MTTPKTPDYLDFSSGQLADYLQKSFVGNMIRYSPAGASPIFVLTSMLGRTRTENVIHQYMSKEMIWPQVTLTASALVGATSVTVGSTAQIVPGDILQDVTKPVGEQVLVTAVPNATTLTIVRAYGTAAAAAFVGTEVLVKIGTAFEQASLRPAPMAINPVPVQNNTQIFRNSWALARTVSVIRPIVGDDLISESKQDAGGLHAADIEKTLIFGQKYSGVRNNQMITKMSGIVDMLQTYAPANITPAGATTNYTQLNAALDKSFNKSVNSKAGNDRILFVGSKALSVINQIGRANGTYQLIQGQETFGLQFKTFSTDRGTFRLIEHPVLNSNPVWASWALGVDITALKLAYLAGVETVHTGYGMDGKAVEGGLDAVGGTLLTELTLENINPSAHTLITGLTAGNAG